jgi:hypothetical protein
LTDDAGEKAVHGVHRRRNPATLRHMHERLGAIEHRTAAIEARPAGFERRSLPAGGGLARRMRVYRCLEGEV